MLRSLPLLMLTCLCAAASPEDVFRTIRANDSESLKKLLKESPAAASEADSHGTAPLHYAAVYGTPESIRILLEAGADVKARSAMEATPLILAAYSPEKLRLLLDAGSDPNAETRSGRTALIIAAGRSGSTAAVKALIDKGGKVEHADKQRGQTPLLAAASNGDLETVRLLLEHGAKPDTPDKGNATPLMNAINTNQVERVRLLLEKGANVNASLVFAGQVKHGPIGLRKLTPLILAAAHGSPEMIQLLLKAGGKINMQDERGMSPLMAAVASDSDNAKTVELLIAAGADVNAKDTMGASVLDWARRANNVRILQSLERAGAKGTDPPMSALRKTEPYGTAEAVNKALDLLSLSSSEFFKQSGCVGCHHQPAAAAAYASAKRAGIQPPQSIVEDQRNAHSSMLSMIPALLLFMDPGGEVETVGNIALGFAAAQLPPSPLTDAAAHYVAGKQNADGSWTSHGIARPPFGESNVERTALGIRVLQTYNWPARKPEFDQRVERARTWLLKLEPQTVYDQAHRLIGLKRSGASQVELKRAAASLLREQKPDGGWSQTRYMASDAFGTGIALYALSESGELNPSDSRYQKGVRYLLQTQLEDGSWHVRSRAPKFQPYFQSGFPHEHDQWISAAATSYAAMALAPAVQQQVASRAKQ